MANYFKDFKNERFHDDNLMRLVRILDESNRLDIFAEHILHEQSFNVGRLINVCRKRDFDVLIQFENCYVIIETKVDSPEGYSYDQWQTERIYESYSGCFGNSKLYFLYITYGLSEFYIKKRSNGGHGAGAYDEHFIHITCDTIQSFIDESMRQCGITESGIVTWRSWLKFEMKKRAENGLYLKDIASILGRYKEDLKLTDYPVNRLNIFVPEFAIPFYHGLCTEWNRRSNALIGKACVYPVGRTYAATSDSILNFSELWYEGASLCCSGALNDNLLYFEFNEDFNLHLKADSGTENIDQVKSFVKANDENLSLGFTTAIENYTQGAYVLYEWDLGILNHSTETNLNNIEKVISNAIQILR